MTFSVVCYDRNQEAWGVGVASKYLAVGSTVPWAKASVGAVATQAYANVSYGPTGLELLRNFSAKEVIEKLTSTDHLKEKRQVAVVDGKGNVAAFTGIECNSFAGHITGEGFSVQGNILAGSEVIEAMASVMEGRGKVEDRIMEALMRADEKGGDRRGRQSAAIFIVSDKEQYEEGSDIMVDLRMDNSPNPLGELKWALKNWKATFFENPMVPFTEAGKIRAKLETMHFRSVNEWASMNNFSSKVSGNMIDKEVLDVLMEESKPSNS
jgi:uncharacterized Ntn-hydrolase superfamily protein